MMTFDQWALKWGISPAAIQDYHLMMGLSDDVKITSDHTESGIQSLVRMEASRKGCRLWRNNVGAAMMKDGSFVRYGLANESKAINSALKSADLIGIRPVIITPVMVGMTFGQFLSREIKRPGWKYTGSPSERSQLCWAELILKFGGDAGFATREGTI